MNAGALLLAAAAASALTGAWIVARPEMELGHVLGALLVGLALGLAAVGAALAVGRRVGGMVLAAYAGAVVGAIASRLWLGFGPLGPGDALPWLGIMAIAGPVLAAAETPWPVLGGAAAALALAALGGRRSSGSDKRSQKSPPRN